MGPGRRQAKVPRKMLEELRWVTTDFAAGDVLIFNSLTVHAALHNVTEFDLRLSVDYRYQLEGEELTEVCLHPHFQRITWEDVYANWKSDRYQYYWKDLDFSSACMRFRREAGYADTCRMLELAPWRAPVDPMEGVIVHELSARTVG